MIDDGTKVRIISDADETIVGKIGYTYRVLGTSSSGERAFSSPRPANQPVYYITAVPVSNTAQAERKFITLSHETEVEIVSNTE